MLFCFRSASLESSHFCDWGTIVSHETVTFIFTLARLPQLEKRNITMTMAAAPALLHQKLQRIYKTSSIPHWAALQTTLFWLMYTAIAILIRPVMYFVLHHQTSLLLLRSFHTSAAAISVCISPSLMSNRALFRYKPDILSWLRLQLTGYQSQYQAFTYDKAKKLLFIAPTGKKK